MNRLHRITRLLALPALLAAATPVAAQSPGSEYDGAAALGLSLRRLGSTQRVLMIAAHPDDENTAVLSSLALGSGADVAYLALTRGEGGQNGIGAELQEALGLIRTEELLAARRLDGARQFFTRAYDYGFSKSAEEAFQHWPKDAVLADVVAVIRRFRPDVVIAIFSGTPADGHGQHQASGIVAREAFAAAGDPARFPEQLASGLRPHRPARLYQASWRGATGEGARLETGAYDPLLGRSHYQVAMASRSRHRSQDMGQALTPGSRPITLQYIAGQTAAPGSSPFAGLDTTLSARAKSLGMTRDSLSALLAAYDAAVPRLRSAFTPLASGRLVPELATALRTLERADAIAARYNTQAAAELRFHLAAELEDARTALARASGVVVDAVASHEQVTPGQRFELELTVWNGGNHPAMVRELEPALPASWQVAAKDTLPSTPLAPGALQTRRFEVRVPADAPASEPYFLRRPRDGDLYHWPDAPANRGLPFEPRELRALARVEIAGTTLPLEREAEHRTVRSTDGEIRRPVRVVPAVSVALTPEVAVLPIEDAAVGSVTANGGPEAGKRGKQGNATAPSAPEKGAGARELRFAVQLQAEAPAVNGTLRLLIPAGWSAEPAAVPLRFTEAGERRQVEFRVRAPSNVAPGAFPVRALFERDDGARYDRGYTLVDYPHITPRPLYREAAATVQAFDVRVASGLRVAYIPGAGDATAEALGHLGVPITTIDPAELATADLTPYHAVVLGIRAYEHRPELVQGNRRLLDYVERGGTLIVQYNQYTYSGGNLAPYPLSIARPHDRVTDETAPVRLLDPAHPILSRPNRIGAADFEGWIQERGLYFPRTWDERYTPLLEMGDPGEAPLQGGLLVARYGKGTYVYTGLALFRQLPAGVPGAYRLLANLVSLGIRE